MVHPIVHSALIVTVELDRFGRREPSAVPVRVLADMRARSGVTVIYIGPMLMVAPPRVVDRTSLVARERESP